MCYLVQSILLLNIRKKKGIKHILTHDMYQRFNTFIIIFLINKIKEINLRIAEKINCLTIYLNINEKH